jgi:Ca2+/H+ antiporter
MLYHTEVGYLELHLLVSRPQLRVTMTNSDTWKAPLGAVLLLIATAAIVAVSGQMVSNVPPVIGSLSALALAAGALLLGTSDTDRPV